MAGVPLLEVGEGGADRVGTAEDVRQHHRAPLLRRLLEEPALRAEARVREHRVDLAEPLECGGDEALLVVPLGDVAAHGERVVLAQLVGELGELVLRARSERDAPSALHGLARGRGADAGAGTGDQEYAFFSHAAHCVSAYSLRAWRRSAHTPASPTCPAGKGHYESFYLKACHPSEPLGIWIRYTVHKHSGQEPQGSLWFTLFDGTADGPLASKVTTAPDVSAPDAYIVIGDSPFEPGRVAGSAETEQLDASWELEFSAEQEALFHLPRDWMYRAPSRRRSCSRPIPDARFDGRVQRGRPEVELDGWRGMVGHNWGAQHAERWIWLHGAGFEASRTPGSTPRSAGSSSARSPRRGSPTGRSTSTASGTGSAAPRRLGARRSPSPRRGATSCSRAAT